ncbi:hypothetical protein BBO_07747 [Beauveria brongniartii RCEF 3172]|uniref:Uncharacterized protein n=1 Tax=Beauveria brongniartii RCEF 3172 TaxID=1081107 RepID=A0A166YYJ4_9HYPO|nr:hypothetical protein BBO_07747 [Beauveria brongniartii RCEF 3172]
MEVDNHSVEELHKISMPSPSDDMDNKPWCLDCAFNAGKPGRPPCKHPPDEATCLFTSSSENAKRRICRRIYALKKQMEYLYHYQFQEMPPNVPELTTHIKYQQLGLHIDLLARSLFTNQIGGQDDSGKRTLDVRKYMGANGKPLQAIGIDELGLWVKIDTELDAEPDFQRLVSHETVTMATSGHGTTVTTSEHDFPGVF